MIEGEMDIGRQVVGGRAWAQAVPVEQAGRESLARRISVAASVLAITGGILVILGWAFGIPLLKSISPAWAPMKVNTAVCFILCGAALWRLNHAPATWPPPVLVRACAGAVAVLSVLTIGEHLLDVNVGIDEMLMEQPLAPADVGHPGRMSVAASLCFLLLGLALLGLDYRNRKGHRTFMALPLATAATGMLAFVGYLYGVKVLYAFSPFSAMAAHTATLFIVVSLGVLCARTDNGPLGILTAQGVGSTMARRMLPFALVLPFLIGWLRLEGERAGLYGFEVGLAMFATANVVLFAALIWFTAVSLNRTDARRSASEAALRDSEYRFRALLEHGTDSIAVVNQDNRILYLSPAVTAVEGYTAEELVGRSGLENTHPDDLPLVGKIVGELLEKPGSSLPVLWRRRHKDGRWLWLEGVATNLLHDPVIRGIVTNYRDVTGRIEAEQDIRRLNADLSARNAELDAERSRWKGVVQGIADEVWVCDLQGIVTLVSVPEVSHLSMEEFRSKPINQVWEAVDMFNPDGSPRAEAQSPLLLALRGETLRGEEIMRVRATGVSRWRQFSAAPIRDAAGKIIGSVAVARDITDRKRAEEEIRRLNAELEERVEQRTAELVGKNRELETFSYSVSHDLKAPLRGIDGYSKLLLAEYESKLDDDGRSFLRNIRTAANRMQELIDDLLAYARLERRSLTAEPIDPAALVGELIAERHDLSAAQLTVDMASDALYADREGLAMVLRNLLDNAVKFSAGRLPQVIEIRSHVEDGMHRITVRDNGTGFDMKYHDRIFQIFQRLHRTEDYEGTGVGLAIAHKAMTRMGGRIWAESEPGTGAAFHVELPRDVCAIDAKPGFAARRA